MNLEIIEDFEVYLSNLNIQITPQALEVFKVAEAYCETYNFVFFRNDLLLPLLEISSLRDIVDKYGGNSENSIEYLLYLIKEGINQSVRGKYRAGEYYSSEEENSERTCILNHCFDIIGVENKRVIDIKTIIIALINSHEEENPSIENSLWCDYRLQTTYNTLSHIAGEYIEGLCVKVDLIKWELNEIKNKDYDLLFSFAGEDRIVAKQIAINISKAGYRVFYDEFEKSDLWGKDLYSHLSDVYGKKGRYCLMLISKSYETKHWTNHERKAAQARAFKENREFILPLVIDDTEIQGLLPTIGFIDLRITPISEIINLICEKLQSTNLQ